MDDQDKLVLTELFTVIHEIQINAYVQNLKRISYRYWNTDL